jgi:invasion protein IalB
MAGGGVRRFILALTLVMLTASTALAATAQAPISSQIFNAWRLDCYPPPPKATEGVGSFEKEIVPRSRCQMEQAIRLQSDRNKVAAVVRVRLSGPQLQPFLLVLLPPTVESGFGLTLAIDEQEPFKIRIRECTSQQCVAALLLDGDWLDALRRGNHLTIAFKVGGTNLATLVALEGFAAAYGRLAAAGAGPAAN